ncbi:MAG: CPBP family intramembrane metalloprotease [Clostridia bacterium]|nr:CPBP family intramembrane metalloprotease [Clostridia bacterium]
MGLFGAEAPAVPSGNVWLLLLGSALLPAFGEELLFRAFPLVAYGNTAKRRFVFLSAAVFAAAHFSVFQIPYAFVSGILFAMIDLAAGSLLPSLIFHFANNSISIVLSVLAVSTGKDLLLPVLCVLGGLSLLSVLHIVRKRAEYRAFFTVEKDADRKQFFTI